MVMTTSSAVVGRTLAGSGLLALAPTIARQVRPAPAECVLVVDDDTILRRALELALRHLGYRALLAEDGETALRMAAAHDVSVVLLDVAMPGMDGYEVCRRLKAMESTKLVPVVILTGSNEREAKLLALDVGASDFLSKPFDSAELGARVRNLVALRQTTRDLDSAEQIVFAIAKAVEARHGETGDHCDRLASLGVRLGTALGLDAADLVTLRRAAYLHDIGKIAVADAVLMKPGPLTADERKVMETHPAAGATMCAELRSFRAVLPVVRHHHERLDGSGYPDGLVGSAIPYLAQVFQVGDVFDALTNDRCYRPAMSVAEALAILRDEVARGWRNAAVVETLAAMVARPAEAGDAITELAGVAGLHQAPAGGSPALVADQSPAFTAGRPAPRPLGAVNDPPPCPRWFEPTRSAGGCRQATSKG